MLIDDKIINNINLALTKLLNQNLQGLGRAADMLWLGFGDPVTYIDIKGNPVIKSMYALHVQCNWEIIDGNKIILSQNDFYESKDEAFSPFIDVDVLGNSKFDELSISLNSVIKANPPYVTDFDTDMVGGFSLKLSNNFNVTVYPYSPMEGESWRFLMPGSDVDHLVIFEE